MFLPNLSRGEKKMALLTGIVLLGSFIFKTVISPTINYWVKMGKEQNEVNLRLIKLERSLEVKDYVNKAYQTYEGQILNKSSEEQEIAELLGELEEISRHVNLDLIMIKPLPVTDERFYKRYMIQLEAEGIMETVTNFLFNLRTSPLLLRVKRIQINAKGEKGKLRVSFLVSRVLVSPEKNENKKKD